MRELQLNSISMISQQTHKHPRQISPNIGKRSHQIQVPRNNSNMMRRTPTLSFGPQNALNPSFTSQSNNSGVSNPHQRDLSPTLSAVSARQQSFIAQLQGSLLNENKNLQDHNAFLLAQIKSMFEREKKYSRTVKKLKRQNKELLEINRELQLQNQQLTKITLDEINKIQKMMQEEKSRLQHENMLSSQSSQPKSEIMGWETQATIKQNLQELKTKVINLVKHPHLRFSDNFHDFVKPQVRQNQKTLQNGSKAFDSKGTEASFKNAYMQNEDLGKYVSDSSPKTPYLNSLKLAEAIKK